MSERERRFEAFCDWCGMRGCVHAQAHADLVAAFDRAAARRRRRRWWSKWTR